MWLNDCQAKSLFQLLVLVARGKDIIAPKQSETGQGGNWAYRGIRLSQRYCNTKLTRFRGFCVNAQKSFRNVICIRYHMLYCVIQIVRENRITMEMQQSNFLWNSARSHRTKREHRMFLTDDEEKSIIKLALSSKQRECR